MRPYPRWSSLLCSLLAAAACVHCSSSSSSAGAPAAADAGGTTSSQPVVTGPVTGGSTGKPFTATSVDLASYGYVEEEYFLQGTASAYDFTSPPGPDGAWSVHPTTHEPYKTRILVRRPTAAKFNGTVVIEWLNVTGGVDADPDFAFQRVELLRSGFAWVGVSAQAAGVVGGGLSLGALTGGAAQPLVKEDTQRYGSLRHPGDDYSYDIFSQAGRALRHAGAIDPLGGLVPQRLLGDGESQSAIRLVMYVDAIHPIARVFDGFFLHSRFGGTAPLSGSADAGVNALAGGPSPARIRTDLDVPVFQFETETDVPGISGALGAYAGTGFVAARQPDTTLLRTWEVAGTSHADQYLIDYSQPSGDAGTDAANPAAGLVGSCGDINAGPQHWVEQRAIHAVDAWLRDGGAPANAQPLVMSDAGLGVATDSYGNALGGIRTAAVDVPIAAYSGQAASSSGIFCAFFGQTTPLTGAQLSTLYPSHADYVSKVTTATTSAQQAGFVLDVDAPAIVAEAQAAAIPQ
ncbi:MAG: alpha/beta hydrolase domain-containing protein [Polyangiaceae bacterium]